MLAILPLHAYFMVMELEQKYKETVRYDLVIAWTFLKNKARELFKKNINLDNDAWLRAKAWCLWKATYELCNQIDKTSLNATRQKQIINDVSGISAADDCNLGLCPHA